MGKTRILYSEVSDENLTEIIQEHEELTMRDRRKKKGGFCRNFCRMWCYRKIVTQTDQYNNNMLMIEEWKK